MSSGVYLQSILASATESVRYILSNSDYISLDTIYNIDSTDFNLNLNDFAGTRLARISDDLIGFTSTLYSTPTNFDVNLIPEKPQIGERFGIFNTISGWLLRTESLSLALIVGLFGFGLLGTIGSTFIRRRIKRISPEEDYDTVVVYDLQGIIINGISAAIVVFLAVKGAVVVFSTDGDNLNPYILFFTCLVASVFSEDVWSWARAKLNQNLGNRENEATEGKNDVISEMDKNAVDAENTGDENESNQIA